jgi:glycine cleavage system H protein
MAEQKDAVPAALRYSREHEWVNAAGNAAGTVTVGITHHAQDELGDIVFVDLPEPGRMAEAGASFGSVESVKAVSEIYSPVSGEIVEVNETLRDAPETMNKDPYGAGWVVKIRLSKPAETEALLDAAGYRAYLAGSGSA